MLLVIGVILVCADLVALAIASSVFLSRLRQGVTPFDEKTLPGWIIVAGGLATASFTGVVVLACLARLARRYVVTTQRVFVVDPVVTYCFPVRVEILRVHDGGLRFGSGEVTVLSRGRWPWSLDFVRVLHEPPTRVLRDVPDVELVLQDLRCALRQGPAG